MPHKRDLPPIPQVHYPVPDSSSQVKTAIGADRVAEVSDEHVAKCIYRASRQRPELFGQDEASLLAILKKEGFRPAPADNRLRLKFWTEFEAAHGDAGDFGKTAPSKQHIQGRMDYVNVVHGVCSVGFFRERYLQDDRRVAWLVTPPAKYSVVQEEGLTFGLEQLRRILEEQDVEEYFDAKTGAPRRKVNVALMELKLKIVQMMDMRVHGDIVRKQLNVHATAKTVGQAMAERSLDDLHGRLKELEDERRRAIHVEALEVEGAEGGGEPKDV